MNRRKFSALIASIVTLGLAGCSGDSDEEPTDSSREIDNESKDVTLRYNYQTLDTITIPDREENEAWCGGSEDGMQLVEVQFRFSEPVQIQRYAFEPKNEDSEGGPTLAMSWENDEPYTEGRQVYDIPESSEFKGIEYTDMMNKGYNMTIERDESIEMDGQECED